MTQHPDSKILIVGAGLVGSLIAIYLAKRGYEVHVYEKRPDLRSSEAETGRSINLALSHRGIRPLKDLGIDKAIIKEVIPMQGRLIHTLPDKLAFVPYGKDSSEYINSVSRTGLNRRLLTLADEYPNIHFYFNTLCEDIDLEKNELTFKDLKKEEYFRVHGEVVLGTDGAGSIVRQILIKRMGFQSSSDFLEHGYKEITIPPLANGSHAIEHNALHIWPRRSYMLIALPNQDGSHTGTLFLSNQGKVSFEQLNSPQNVLDFFEQSFPDVMSVMPNLAEEFMENPVGVLGTVKCEPWHYKGKVLLIGDSAHAIVPFYGQGMNASFEDCFLLDQCIEANFGDWEKIFTEYQKERKKDADAIAELALENFYEMRDGVADPAFLKIREIEHVLENKYSDYHSKYSLVTFHPEIPYTVAHQRGNLQNKILLEIVKKAQSLGELDIHSIYTKLKKEVGF